MTLMQGPFSPDRYDLTLCFEYGVFYGTTALLASVFFLARIIYLWTKLRPHGLGRTEYIYWPTQFAMSVAAGVAFTQGLVIIFSADNHSPIQAMGCLCMGIAWSSAVLLNHSEHMYHIRSSTSICTFYVWSIASALAIIRTTLDLDLEEPLLEFILLCAFSAVLSFGLAVEAWPRGHTAVQKISGSSEYDKANIFSRLMYHFFQPLVRIGTKRPLTVPDLANLLSDKQRTINAYSAIATRWNHRVYRYRSSPHQSPPSLFWTILRTYTLSMVSFILCRIVIIFLTYIQPLILSELLSYLQDHTSKPVTYGFMLAFGLFIFPLGAVVLFTYNRFQMFMSSVTIKAALISIIYRKALRLSPGARQQSTTGEITNHMAVDAETWGDALIYLSMWLAIPLELGVALYLLYSYLGWSMLAGVFTMIALLPLQAWQAKVYESMQGAKLAAMDKRIRQTTEVLSGIKVTKLYGWESAFLKRILAIRKVELGALKKLGLVQASMDVSFIASNLVISLLTFGVYAYWGGPDFTPGVLTPQKVFVSMTLFSLLRNPIQNLSDATTTTVVVAVATKRLQEFLLREELDESSAIRFNSLPKDPREPVILIKDANFSWHSPTEDTTSESEHQGLLSGQDDHFSTRDEATLQSINLQVRNGTLTAIVGRVGQGKSSLFSALLGEMYKLQGKIQISGRLAYVPQQAWIVNASLRDNILFGNAFDESRYNAVVAACGLTPDIAILPAGDMTEIGERGINLSGGQKQRVSLARAAYDDADIYLLDDPLSAVDAHVDQHLWEHLIGPAGLLKNKARVLATHGINHLKEADQIVVLKDGAIAEQGHYSELMHRREIFYQLIKEYSVTRKDEFRKKLQRKASASSAKSRVLDVVDDNGGGDISSSSSISLDGELGSDVSNETEASGDETAVAVLNPSSDPVDPKKNGAELVAAEKLKDGAVGWHIAMIYVKAARYKTGLLIILLSILAQMCLVGSNLWLKHWIKLTEDPDLSPPLFLFLCVYSLLTVCSISFYTVLMCLGYSVARIRASEILHTEFLSKILRLPMSFFDTTPLGRILNRFSGDISTVDERIPTKMIQSLYFGVTVASILLLISFTTPTFIFLIPFLVLGYGMIQSRLLVVSRSLMRIYSVSKSPVFQHFNETLNGISTIRAMQLQKQFILVNAVKTDNMANNFVATMTVKRWAEIQLRLLSTGVVLCAAVLAVVGRDRIDASLVGLTLSFAMTFTEGVSSLVRISSDLQNHLISVERVAEYTELRTEAPATTDVALSKNWPQDGHIVFRNYSTRYREGLDLVIKNISLDIRPGEKIGIVGRTGAGKSSLTLALFRIVEAANSYWAKASDNSESFDSGHKADESATAVHVGIGSMDSEDEDGGSIEIDGINISTVGLEDLRQHLAIIPQDPTLFAGTVQATDAELWEALERSHLKPYIQFLSGGLSHEVLQGGENFSVGQRSLICLARALLRKAKILVLDEATAAVDVETDQLIQKTIREEFRDRTILTIAHRIKTVMDSDRILVLDQGRVQEFEAPQVLLKNQESFFYRLAQQAGEI
ncbi:Multidrug resistance-associated protein 1 [Podila verticillata]|nr:Multidrug resistance-associated protein 1 [Podila verticillata]